MLEASQRQKIADFVWNHWNAGTEANGLPPALIPATRADAYAVQALFEQRSVRPLFGWKIAATSVAGQKHIGVDGPLAGRILAEKVIPEGALCDLTHCRMKFAEAEFAFRMGCDLPPRAAPRTQVEVMAAVASLHVGIEIPDSRFSQYEKRGALQLICDDACAHQFYLGPECKADWRALDLSKLTTAGRVLDAQGKTKLEWPGSGANVLGDPRIALTWLANELSAHGVTLGAGLVVTTGTCVPPMTVAPGETFVADLGAVGQARLKFGA